MVVINTVKLMEESRFCLRTKICRVDPSVMVISLSATCTPANKDRDLNYTFNEHVVKTEMYVCDALS